MDQIFQYICTLSFFFNPKLRFIITIKVLETDDDRVIYHKRFARIKNEYNVIVQNLT